MTDMNANDAAAAAGLSAGATVYKINANMWDKVPNGTKGKIVDFSGYNGMASVEFEGIVDPPQIIVTARCLSLTAPTATAAPASNGGGVDVVTGKTPDDEMIAKILHTLGVDPSDWGNSLSGIYAAIRSNQQIGDGIDKVEDWTDGELNDYSLTESMFKLLERAQKAESELAAANSALAAERQRVAVCEGIIEQATHYSKIELPDMSETAQLAWLHSMRGHVLDILLAAAALDGEKAG